MTPVRIPISKPSFDERDREAIVRSLESGWVVQGPLVREFEAKVAAFADVPFAAATTSCTTALQVCMAALGLKPGDEVIVPSFTWIATPNVVEHMGAQVVFCDVDLATFNINTDQLASLVGPNTVGVIPVHLFGLCADIERIVEVADRHGLWVVEDAACALGSRVHGRHAGDFGQLGCFSFHPRKAVTTGEGGLITTRDAGLDKRVRSLRDHGASVSDHSRHVTAGSYLLPDYEVLGYNFRMTDIQAALGSAQMDRAASILAARRRQAQMYDERLSTLEWLDTPVCPDGWEHSYQSYVCLFRPDAIALSTVDQLSELRGRVMARLEEQGIATRQGTHAPPFTHYYRGKYGFKPQDLPNAYIAERLSLSLPLYAELAEAQIDEICTALRGAVGA